MKKSKITIDDLAVMVQNGFTEMRESMDKRFDGIEIRLDILEEGLEEIKEELKYIKTELNKRVDNLGQILTLRSG